MTDKTETRFGLEIGTQSKGTQNDDTTGAKHAHIR